MSAQKKNGLSRNDAESAVRTLLEWIGEDPDRAGIRLPLAVTYASKTQDGSEDEWNFNAGMNFEMEKITSWLRIGELASALGGDYLLGK